MRFSTQDISSPYRITSPRVKCHASGIFTLSSDFRRTNFHSFEGTSDESFIEIPSLFMVFYPDIFARVKVVAIFILWSKQIARALESAFVG